MDNPRLRDLPEGEDRTTLPSSVEQKKWRSAAEFAASEADIVERLRDRFGDDLIVQLPLINPIKIIEEAQYDSMEAARLCQQACGLLERGYRRRLRQYLSAGYIIACSFRDNENQIERLANHSWDNRTKTFVNAEVVRSNILHYLFIFIFHQSGMATRNRATQYAQALQVYFDQNMPNAKVADHLHKFGPEKLRRAALRRANLILASQELATKGGDPSAITMDDVLGEIQAEEAAKRSVDPQEEVTDYGPRELPPLAETQNEAETDEAGGDDGEENVDDDATPTAEDETCGGEAFYAGAGDGQDNQHVTNEADSIDGHVTDEVLEKIVMKMLNLGVWLGKQSIETETKKHSILTIVRLTNELLALRRIINGV